VSVFNKRNAAVGYIALKVASRKLRRRRKRSGAKVALIVGLGIVSVGVLAGLAFVLLRRQQGESEQTERSALGDQTASEVIGEYVTASPEPIPAT
jgi:uncharacterized membrane protein